MAVFENALDFLMYGVVYLNDKIAQITCPRCGHEYQVLRSSFARRVLRQAKNPRHCKDCKWIIRQLHED